MCVDFMNLPATLRDFEQSGIEYIHVDIMDGSFVPNFTLGTDFVKQLKANTAIPLDIHMMVNDPETKLDWFDFGEGDMISVHAESTRHLHKAIAAIQARGAKAFVAINPGTPLSALDAVIDLIDGVLVMTVNPGFAGQKLIPSTLNKIRELRTRYPKLVIECDGNVSFENARKMSAAGADIFVAGTSSVFTKELSLPQGIQKLRDVIDYNDLWQPRPDHIPVLGHRGICARYPENTLISFEAAIRAGVDLIEFDVNITKDGVPVVIHDNTIDRTSDHEGLTRDYTLEQLKTFDFGSHKDAAFAGTPIPTLDEVLTLAAPHEDLALNVEIKDMTEECVDKTVAALRRFDLCERAVIACFDAAILRLVKAKYPYMRCQGFPGRHMQNFTEDIYDCMFGMGIPIHWKSCTEPSIAADIALARDKGILRWLFTADTEELVERMVTLGTDNITGNDPEVALNYLRTHGLHR